MRLGEIPERLGRITASGGYNAQIDGLRFLAILPVLVWHATVRGNRAYVSAHVPTAFEAAAMNHVPVGTVGVCLFFFVSGFIIAFPFLRAGRGERARPSVRTFYLRRLLRLAPAYMIVLTGCYLMLALTGYAPKDAPKFNAVEAPLHESFLASLFYVHNLVFGASSKLNPPLWSLEVEMQFYLAAPFLLLGYSAIGNRVARRIVGAAAVLAGLWVAHWPALIEAMQGRHIWSIASYSHYFFLGILVSDIALDRQWTRRAWADGLLALGFAAMLLAGVPRARPETLAALGIDAALLASVLAIYVGAARGRLGGRLLGAPWIALVGGACYSIYLVHVPLMQAFGEVVRRVWVPDSLFAVWAIFGLSIALSLVAGLVFYVLVERPTMKADWPAQLWRRLRPGPRGAA
jgi:peptidoglycan/LPS O-acetylase OafA/YrhL